MCFNVLEKRLFLWFFYSIFAEFKSHCRDTNIVLFSTSFLWCLLYPRRRSKYQKHLIPDCNCLEVASGAGSINPNHIGNGGGGHFKLCLSEIYMHIMVFFALFKQLSRLIRFQKYLEAESDPRHGWSCDLDCNIGFSLDPGTYRRLSWIQIRCLKIPIVKSENWYKL